MRYECKAKTAKTVKSRRLSRASGSVDGVPLVYHTVSQKSNIYNLLYWHLIWINSRQHKIIVNRILWDVWRNEKRKFALSLFDLQIGSDFKMGLHLKPWCHIWQPTNQFYKMLLNFIKIKLSSNFVKQKRHIANKYQQILRYSTKYQPVGSTVKLYQILPSSTSIVKYQILPNTTKHCPIRVNNSCRGLDKSYGPWKAEMSK